jgi:hypothetical protein
MTRVRDEVRFVSIVFFACIYFASLFAVESFERLMYLTSVNEARCNDFDVSGVKVVYIMSEIT